MTPQEVAAVLGPVRNTRQNRKDQLVEYRNDGSRVQYSETEGVIEMSFAQPSRLMLGSTDLLSGHNQVAILSSLDDQPMEYAGFLFFFKIGLAMTGFHDRQKDQEAITVFKDGLWNNTKAKAKPYKP